MHRGAFQGGILALWLVSMGWLVRYDAYPEYFTSSVPGYRALLQDDLLALDSWWKISIQGVHAGYMRSWISIQENDPVEHYVVENETVMRIRLLGSPQSIAISMQAALDVGYQLHSFRCSARAGPYRTELHGRRTQGRRFRVEINMGDSRSSVDMEIPDDTLIYAPITEMAFRRMKPGDILTMRTFNPLTQENMPSRVRALRREALNTASGMTQATVLSIESFGVEFLSWIDADGRVLRQESPLGVLETSTAAECLKFKLGDADAPDPLRTLDPISLATALGRLGAKFLANESNLTENATQVVPHDPH